MQRERKPDREGCPPRLLAAKGFRSYKPEEERAARKPEVDRSLQPILEAWERIAAEYEMGQYIRADSFYPKIFDCAKGLALGEGDIERVTMMLGAYKDIEGFDQKAGLFLSALVNLGPGGPYTLDFTCFGKDAEASIPSRWDTGRPAQFGYWNTKDITVVGSVGIQAALQMAGGRMRITGDAGDELGTALIAGTIIVEGNAGERVGDQRMGGEIHLMGDYGGIARGRGLIFHRGRLIRGRQKK